MQCSAGACRPRLLLSRQPSLPIFLDEVAEASHPVLALAILRAFVVAGRKAAAGPSAAAPLASPTAGEVELPCGLRAWNFVARMSRGTRP